MHVGQSRITFIISILSSNGSFLNNFSFNKHQWAVLSTSSYLFFQSSTEKMFNGIMKVYVMKENGKVHHNSRHLVCQRSNNCQMMNCGKDLKNLKSKKQPIKNSLNPGIVFLNRTKELLSPIMPTAPEILMPSTFELHTPGLVN